MKLPILVMILALSSASLHAAGSQAPLPPPVTVNPYAPSYQHEYRLGAVPTLRTQARMRQWQQDHATTADSRMLSYGGGSRGWGVTNGQNKVYLVFYGKQWGTASKDGNGNLAFTNDTAGAAGAAQQMFKGIGSNGETWQNDLTQWCDAGAMGATSCAAGVARIQRQQNLLAGVWYDQARSSPAVATKVQLANEAIAAAQHFGNTTAASNDSTYYVILSPMGTNPDNFVGSFCGWHSSTTDMGVASPYGELAFSNQPYTVGPDTGCGDSIVNSGTAGALDDWTITLGHEWHEMMSDRNGGGWTNHVAGTYANEEDSDECQTLLSATPGGPANVVFATGTFALQQSWSNDSNNCVMSHADVSSGTAANKPPTANFGFTTLRAVATFTDSSKDSDGTITAHVWAFGDGSSATTVNPTHKFPSNGTYNVMETVTDNDGATVSKTSEVTVVSARTGGGQLLVNPGFETYTAWVPINGVVCFTGCAGEVGHGGKGFAWLNGIGQFDTYLLSQTVAIPAGMTSGNVSYYLHIDTAETTTTAKNDTLTVQLFSGSTPLRTLATFSNLNAKPGYVHVTHDISSNLDQPNLTLRFTGVENGSSQTSFVLDDVTMTVQ